MAKCVRNGCDGTPINAHLSKRDIYWLAVDGPNRCRCTSKHMKGDLGHPRRRSHTKAGNVNHILTGTTPVLGIRCTLTIIFVIRRLADELWQSRAYYGTGFQIGRHAEVISILHYPVGFRQLRAAYIARRKSVVQLILEAMQQFYLSAIRLPMKGLTPYFRQREDAPGASDKRERMASQIRRNEAHQQPVGQQSVGQSSAGLVSSSVCVLCYC